MKEQYQFSYWEQTSLIKSADVGIVGAGLTGLQLALTLKTQRPDWEIMVLERGPFSRGASTRNAGFACFGSPTELLEDLANPTTSPTAVWDTVAERYAGIQRLQEQYGAFANYQQHGGYEVYDETGTRYPEVLDALPEINAELASITGESAVWHPVKECPGIRPGTPLLYNALEGQLHPGLLVQHLERRCRSAGIQLHFGVEVAPPVVEDKRVALPLRNGGTLYASQVVLTTNAFTPQLLPDTDLYPARNQVLVTAPIPGLQLRGCFHYERGYVYFRNLGADRILIGGARHLANEEENTPKFGANENLHVALGAMLRRWLVDVGSKVEFAQHWSGIIAQGSAKNPIVERVNERCFVAARLAGMGVAISASVAENAAKLVLTSA